MPRSRAEADAPAGSTDRSLPCDPTQGRRYPRYASVSLPGAADVGTVTTARIDGPGAALGRSALFAGWSAEALAVASSRFRPRAVGQNEVICVQDEPGDEMYVVETGRFAVDIVVADRPVRLAELGPGAVFGEIAVVAHRPRSATVTALSAGRLWGLRRADFADLARQFPSLAVTAGRLATTRLGDTERQLANEPQAVLTLQPGQAAITIGRVR